MKLIIENWKKYLHETVLEEAPTGEERAVVAASKEFAQYLKSQGLRSMDHATIKKHLIDLGLPPSVAGQYALFSAQTFKTPERMVDDEYEKLYGQEYDELEEGGYTGHADDDHSKAGKEKRSVADPAEEEPLRLSRPKHDPADRSAAGLRARRRLQGKGIPNYPLDK